MDNQKTRNPEALGLELCDELDKFNIGEINIEKVKNLIEQGADLTVNGGRPARLPFKIAAQWDLPEIHDLMLAKKAPTEGALASAVSTSGSPGTCSEKTFRRLVSIITSPEEREDAFVFATMGDNFDYMKILFEAGVNINAPNRYGARALIEALRNFDKPEIFDFLLQNNADLNVIEDEDGLTALIYLIQKLGPEEPSAFLAFSTKKYNPPDRMLQIKNLLAAKADPNAPDKYGFPPLCHAAAIKSVEAVELLWKAGADFNLALRAADDARNDAVVHFLHKMSKQLSNTFIPVSEQDKLLVNIFNLVSEQQKEIKALTKEVADLKNQLPKKPKNTRKP